MATFTYVMCAATSLACAVLLLRGYSRSRFDLLYWGGLCFALLAISNTLLVIDLVFIGPEISLSLPRNLLTLAGLCVMIYSLVWETR